MSLLYSAFRFSPAPSFEVVRSRADAIRQFYVESGFNVRERLLYSPETGVGIHVLWQTFKNEQFRHVAESEDRLTILSNLPFGWSDLVPSTTAIETIGMRIADALIKSPRSVGQLHPPLTVLDFDKRQQKVAFFVDMAGVSKSFHLRGQDHFVISNRCIAAHMMARQRPTPDPVAWAADQMCGWLHSDFTPFSATKRNVHGSIIYIDSRKVECIQQNLVVELFAPEQSHSVSHGYDRMQKELKALGEYGPSGVALSGGRDSRGSAALASKIMPGNFHLRTSYPPVLEKTIAEQLVERMNEFGSFSDGKRFQATRSDGSLLWIAQEKKTPALKAAAVKVGMRLRMSDRTMPGLLDRARGWARAMEGNCLAGMLATKCNFTIFTKSETRTLALHGAGGEIARGYGYTRPVERTPDGEKDFEKQIGRTTAKARLEKHRLTSKSSVYFARDEYWPEIQKRIDAAWKDSEAAGLGGYRFFDYWYIISRLAKTGGGYHSTRDLLPFLAPEFMSHGVRQTDVEKLHGSLIQKMVAEYQPSWRDVPYFDQAKTTAPKEKSQVFSRADYLWQNAEVKDFIFVLRKSPALNDRPFDRAKVLSHFQNLEQASESVRTFSQHRAYGLIHYHAFRELCEEVGTLIGHLPTS